MPGMTESAGLYAGCGSECGLCLGLQLRSAGFLGDQTNGQGKPASTSSSAGEGKDAC